MRTHKYEQQQLDLYIVQYNHSQRAYNRGCQIELDTLLVSIFSVSPHTVINFVTMAPLRTLAALILGASAVSAFAPTTPLATRNVVPAVR